MDDITAAQTLIRALDLTSLGKDDNEFKIEALCEKASTKYGNVAAVCVYPKFIPLVKRLLNGTDIKAATVVNFPDGGWDFDKLRSEIRKAVKLGADEIDAVFPYKKFLEGDEETCENFLRTVKEECGKKHTLKIILETGELQKTSLIAKASQMCIAHGANFIKTSTGKSKISATPEAANIILETIANSQKNVGFKASGGIRTFEEARKYLVLANSIMGGKWPTAKHFRIGASSLIDDLLAVLNRG